MNDLYIYLEMTLICVIKREQRAWDNLKYVKYPITIQFVCRQSQY